MEKIITIDGVKYKRMVSMFNRNQTFDKRVVNPKTGKVTFVRKPLTVNDFNTQDWILIEGEEYLKVKDTRICGFCTEYDVDNTYCPHRGEMFEEDTCDGWKGEDE